MKAPPAELNLFRSAIMHSYNAVVITDADPSTGYAVRMANPAFCEMTGYSLDELRGRSLRMLQGPETDAGVIQHLRECLAAREYFEGSTTNYRKDGTPYIVRWNISPVFDDAGELTNFVSVQQDISDYVRSQGRNHLLARALDASNEPILLLDKDFTIVFVNSAFCAETGYLPQELVGHEPLMLRSGLQDESFFHELRRTLAQGETFRGMFVNRRKDGSIYHANQSVSPIRDESGKISHYVNVSRNVSEFVHKEQQLKRAATIDGLTQLRNRSYGEQALKRAFENAVQRHQPLSLILCDVDHFKSINDGFGHPAGDEVLREVAGTLRKGVRNRDAVIRWGGEEFLVVLEDCGAEPAALLAERLRKAVEALAPAPVGKVTASLGVAELGDGEALEALLARADAALYQAKREGRNRVCMAAGG